MNPYAVALLCVLVFINAVFGVLLFQAKQESRAAHTALDQAMDAAERADFRVKVYEDAQDDLLKRPIQALIPRDAVEVLGQAILRYLADSMSGPMEVPIFPREPKEKK